MFRLSVFFTLVFCHIYESEEIKAMTIHTIPKHTCPSCGGEGEYLGALLDTSGEIWDNINGKRGYPWENNDWVFVYEFMRRENYGKN